MPAAVLAVVVTTVLAAAPLYPVGVRNVLVRAPAGAALPADVAIVASPVAGYSVLHGDAGVIRAVFGRAVAWEDAAPCSTRL